MMLFTDAKNGNVIGRMAYELSVTLISEMQFWEKRI